MNTVCVTTRSQWRRWLAKNHDREPSGIWLVFHRKETGKPSLDYEDAVEEALCYGWIDSTVRKMDDERYCRKFTPRNHASQWSALNRRRAEKTIREGRMTRIGLAKIEAAKKAGRWESSPRPKIAWDLPGELAAALSRNRKAKIFFDRLAPTYQKRFIGWIVTAKRPETRAQRLRESLILLARGEKLGLK